MSAILSLFFCSICGNYTLLLTIHLEYYQPEIKAGLECEKQNQKMVYKQTKKVIDSSTFKNSVISKHKLKKELISLSLAVSV